MIATKPPFFGFTPVIPQFYWDVESAEDRIKKLCMMLKSLQDWAHEAGIDINELEEEFQNLLDEFEQFKETGFEDYYAAQLEEWVNEHMPEIISCAIKMVFFGLTDDGYFCAYIPKSWSEITFDTGAVYGTEQYGRLILKYNACGCGVIDNTEPGYPGSTTSDIEQLKAQVSELRHTVYTALTTQG